MITGMRRSSLYVPGDSEKMLGKSAGADADLILLNLEDGVAASVKDRARDNVVRALASLDFGSREVVVRVNGIGTEAGARDLAAVLPLKPDGICLPKVQGAAEIRAAGETLRALEAANGIDSGKTAIHAMIESAAGVLKSAEIAGASSRMASLIFGSADYAMDVRCRPGENREELALALQGLVLAARAAGIDAIDAPCFDIRNEELLRRECTQARRLGFDGKNALHPGQLKTINEMFDATPEEVAWATEVLAGMAEAEGRGRSVALLDGRLIDDPHRAVAERILRRHAARRTGSVPR